MATYEQLIAAARKADQAGDEAAAKRFLVLAREAKGGNAPQPTPQADGPDLNAMRAGAQARIDQDEATGANAANWMNRAGETMTFGLVGDEASARMDAMLGRGSYDERLNARREQEAKFQAEHPGAALSADIFGSLVPGIGMARGAIAAPSPVVRMARGAGAGALAGGTFGFMEGEGSPKSRARGAAYGAGVGGAFGLAVPAAGAAIGATTAPFRRAAASKKWVAGVPSGDDLKAVAKRAYRRAEQTGVAGDEAWTAALAKKATDVLRAEGLVAPSGRVHASAYPKVQGVLSLLDDYAKGPPQSNGGRMTVKEMQAVRRAIQGVAKSTDPAEARIGAMLLDTLDDATSSLAPDLRVAREAYSRAKSGDLIDTTIELAKSDVRTNYTAAGYEHALRKRFAALNRDIIKGRLKVSPEQAAAIKRVAEGGPVENVARGLGRMAPSGPMNLALTGGMPFLVGNAIGGPGVGAVTSGAMMGVGTAGRLAASRMQSQNAEIAAALMRAGKKAKLPAVTGQSTNYLDRLLFMGAPIGTAHQR